MPDTGNLSVQTLLVLLLVVLAVAVLSKYVRVPYTVALVVAGLAIGLLIPGQERGVLTPDLILFVFLPVLLFEGAYNLPAHRLRGNLAPIALLAVPGVLLGAGATAALVHYLLGLEWGPALLFGALVAATDPVAVLALFRQLGAPHRLSTIVEGESLFNDGTAFALFTIILAAIEEGTFSFTGGALDFAVEVLGALAVGSAIGFGGSLLLRAVDDYLLEITATFAAAYGAFLLADRLHFSGVIAVVMVGLFFGNYGAATAMTPATQYALSATWDFAGFIANSLIFLLIGLALDPETLTSIWPYLVVGFVASLLGRAMSVYGLSPLLRGRFQVSPAYRHVLVWGGLRGALSLALVLSLPLDFPNRTLLQGMTFGVVGASLLLQGLTMGPLLRRLGLASSDPARDGQVLGQARLVALEAASTSLAMQYQNGEINETTYQRLAAAYKRQQERLMRQVARQPERQAAAEDSVAEAARKAVQAEKAALEELHREGNLSDEALDTLEREIDERLSSAAE